VKVLLERLEQIGSAQEEMNLSEMNLSRTGCSNIIPPLSRK
jgi:hypothetical protein